MIFGSSVGARVFPAPSIILHLIGFRDYSTYLAECAACFPIEISPHFHIAVKVRQQNTLIDEDIIGHSISIIGYQMAFASTMHEGAGKIYWFLHLSAWGVTGGVSLYQLTFG